MEPLLASTSQTKHEIPMESLLDEALKVATSVADREAEALHHISDTLRRSPKMQRGFRHALQLALQYTSAVPGNPGGKIIVVGVGKSGIIARKIASMLLSLGTQAVFLHPADCLHGDLGMVCPEKDVVLAMSQSGTTSEVVAFLQLDVVQGCRRIAMTSNSSSPLAKLADAWIDCSTAPDLDLDGSLSKANGSPPVSEAYPEIPAPTSSTTVMLAVGDAFAIALTHAKGIERETFIKNHPGGQLGVTFGLESLRHRLEGKRQWQ
ncbi:hypothetical protein MYAM1_004050 [Malassezia yamatoensis]|uniref:SIS domain-containing protein n=1 Tax=Malassezia yamatoensis TaxID=253288 RepID=A0AAJ5Z135_9BASI|nr:hypothetical protein MYAM1_004050 [Malassezia yamatoensis]